MGASETVIGRGWNDGNRLDRGPVRWMVRLAAGFVLVLVVLGLGMGAPGEPRSVSSAAEQAQQDAEGRFRALAAQVRGAAVDDPSTADLLGALATDLDVQADAVALPWPAADGAAPAAATGVPGGSPPAGAAPADAQSVLVRLRDSAEQSLRDAVTAEPGPARVLAAAGANQWRHAVLLGEALDVDPGLPSVEAAVITGFDRISAPRSAPAGEDCTGTEQASDAERLALESARLAEEEARYGYEVAAALMGDPAPALARARLHGDLANAAARRLGALCVPVAAAPPAYAIDAAFRADPAAALRELEQDGAELYAGLVSTVGPGGRGWIVASFNAATQRSLAAGTPLDALPGLRVDVP
ncbi:DUF4439 domain-containing protein [Arthrobacter echini]|uniref:DUF4439 domain-containing protein n=1 Tax=Arthrobacter echini TaxID=1529066 RepID=A0A4S5E7U6_9MICC|nr:DUF4439 domain-containing protein [Arthrobacter echini]THJ67736.1 DUF4439 domain-containing protein [Arthrobacter echini]